jgi:hypothetical protein
MLISNSYMSTVKFADFYTSHILSYSRRSNPQNINSSYNYNYNMRNNVVRPTSTGQGNKENPFLQSSVRQGAVPPVGHIDNRGYSKERTCTAVKVRKTMQVVHHEILRQDKPNTIRDSAVLPKKYGGNHRMAETGTIKCACGGDFVEKITSFEDVEAPALVCTLCGHTTLTKEQALEVMRLRQLHETVDSDRKIIQVGNSFGFTLPEKLKSLGVKIGQKVRIRALTPNSFEVIFRSARRVRRATS